MAAGYFNPKSIHVAQAEASREGNAVKVFIELRDVNYPRFDLHADLRPGERSAQRRLLSGRRKAALPGGICADEVSRTRPVKSNPSL